MINRYKDNYAEYILYIVFGMIEREYFVDYPGHLLNIHWQKTGYSLRQVYLTINKMRQDYIEF